MNLNLGTGGFGGRALPFSVLAVFAAAGLTSCAGKSATAPTPPGTATYEGVFAGGKGENGVLTITVPAATSAPALSHTTTRASLGVASSPFDVTGTLAFVGGGSVNLTGTFDGSTGALSLTGGAYTFTGSLVQGVLGGTYVGPSGSGSFSTLTSSSNSVRVFCGTYSGVDPGTGFHFNGIWNVALVNTSFAGAGVSLSDDPDPVFTLRGTLHGNAVTLTASKAHGASMTEQGTLSGNSISGGGDNETWQASTDTCH